MDPTTNYLIDQLRTGLIQAEELTRPEVEAVLMLKKEHPATVPSEVISRLMQVAGKKGRDET